MGNVLIIGGNRGIGLALVKTYLDRGDSVWATYRNDSGPLPSLGVNAIPDVDVTSQNGAQNLQSGLAGVDLDTVIINAGLLVRTPLDDLSFEEVERQFSVNSMGPLRMALAVLPHLKDGSKIGIMTSRMGSLADNTSGGSYGYRLSKAAVNAAGKSLSHDLRGKGISVALLHPGYVRTDMTWGSGEVEPKFAATGLVQRMDELTMDTSGSFWHAQGAELPW